MTVKQESLYVPHIHEIIHYKLKLMHIQLYRILPNKHTVRLTKIEPWENVKESVLISVKKKKFSKQ